MVLLNLDLMCFQGLEHYETQVSSTQPPWSDSLLSPVLGHFDCLLIAQLALILVMRQIPKSVMTNVCAATQS